MGYVSKRTGCTDERQWSLNGYSSTPVVVGVQEGPTGRSLPPYPPPRHFSTPRLWSHSHAEPFVRPTCISFPPTCAARPLLFPPTCTLRARSIENVPGAVVECMKKQ